MKTYLKIAGALLAGLLVSSTTVFAQSSSRFKGRSVKIYRTGKTSKVLQGKKRLKSRSVISKKLVQTQRKKAGNGLKIRPNVQVPGIKVAPGAFKKPNFPSKKPFFNPNFPQGKKFVQPKVKMNPRILIQPVVGAGGTQRFFIQPSPGLPPISLGFTAVMNGQGLRIVSVTCGSHAERIGLETGDVITRIDGRKFFSIAQFRNILAHVIIHHNGRLKLRIRNIRHYYDPWQPMYVNRVYFLPTFVPYSSPGYPIAAEF